MAAKSPRPGAKEEDMRDRLAQVAEQQRLQVRFYKQNPVSIVRAILKTENAAEISRFLTGICL